MNQTRKTKKKTVCCKKPHKTSKKNQKTTKKVKQPLPLCRRVTTLSGPTLFYFNQISQKNILILGEYHTVDFICPPSEHNMMEIHDYLWQLASFAPVKVDFFIEDYYGENALDTGNYCHYGECLNQYTSPVMAIRERFREVRDQQLTVSNLRYHAIDVRQCLENTTTCNNQLLLFVTELEKYNIDFFGYSYQEIYNIIDYYLGFCTDSIFWDMFLQFAHYSLFRQPLPNKLLKIYQREVESVHILLQKYKLKSLQKFIHRYVKLKQFNNLLDVLNLGQDLYVLGELLTQPHIKYAVIYVGEKHAEFLIYVLESIYKDARGRGQHVRTFTHENQCLHLSKPFDFFSR